MLASPSPRFRSRPGCFARSGARLRSCGLGLSSLLLACVAPEAGPLPDGPCALREPEVPTPPLHTPRWAFLPWISKDISDTQDTYDFVDGFRSRDIPVGAVVLDSPWETSYNSFQPSESRYPRFGKLVSDLHSRGVRVVLWITPLTNTSSFDLEPGGDKYSGPSANYQPAKDCGYFINDGETSVWWKGQGSAIDFFNPAARAFWHAQQDSVLGQGIDGWKLDFGESYIAEDPQTLLKTAAGEKTLQAYSEAYYRDFLSYGVKQRGPEFVTMVRAYDASYQFAGRFFARREHAPVAWMGDNRRDFVGLADALDHMFVSARAGYTVLGSDIGGYLDVDDLNPTGPNIPFDPEVFLRWTAMSALTPFMQLHGRANLAPWTVPARAAETVAAYRFFAKLHEQLVPFFYSLSRVAQPRGEAILVPQGEPKSWPGDYRYQIGQALLVAPILDGSGVRDVVLPAGARWADFFDLAAVYPGGSTVRAYDARDPKRLPLFLREGAIVPLDIHDDSTWLGDSDAADALSLLMFPGPESRLFLLYDSDDQPTGITAQSRSHGVDVTVSRAPRRLFLLLRLDAQPVAVQASGISLPIVAGRLELRGLQAGYTYDASSRLLVAKLPSAPLGHQLSITLP